MGILLSTQQAALLLLWEWCLRTDVETWSMVSWPAMMEGNCVLMCTKRLEIAQSTSKVECGWRPDGNIYSTTCMHRPLIYAHSCKPLCKPVVDRLTRCSARAYLIRYGCETSSQWSTSANCTCAYVILWSSNVPAYQSLSPLLAVWMLWQLRVLSSFQQKHCTQHHSNAWHNRCHCNSCISLSETLCAPCSKRFGDRIIGPWGLP